MVEIFYFENKNPGNKLTRKKVETDQPPFLWTMKVHIFIKRTLRKVCNLIGNMISSTIHLGT